MRQVPASSCIPFLLARFLIPSPMLDAGIRQTNNQTHWQIG
jgi:hypothetical protein